jgi:phosphoglycolate phosphatase
MMACKAVLFDLDGTLVDSAPDLAGSANRLRALQGLPPLPLAALRPFCGSGARGMLEIGLDLRPLDAGYEAARLAFLADYAEHLLDGTHPFADVDELLKRLAARGLRWGIVTNKAESLAQPLQQAFAALQGAAVLVGGDTTPHRKPHPAPLLEAARRLGLAPQDCIYVGDDERDIQAARAAGMSGLAACWGYLGAGAGVQAWGAAALLEKPLQLLDCLAA